jgi:hypothetical protein
MALKRVLIEATVPDCFLESDLLERIHQQLSHPVVVVRVTFGEAVAGGPYEAPGEDPIIGPLASYPGCFPPIRRPSEGYCPLSGGGHDPVPDPCCGTGPDGSWLCECGFRVRPSPAFPPTTGSLP